MTAIPLSAREKHLKTSRTLFSDVKEIRELPDGYEFRLEDDASALLGLLCAPSAFSASLRLCGGLSMFLVETHQNDHRRDAENAE
jgi:hypothetical protein